MIANEIKEGVFCRVKNRIDIVGKVTRVNGRFVCLEVPQFKGSVEYPMNLVEYIDWSSQQDENDATSNIEINTMINR